jgi:hypothetical protein
MRKPNTTKPKSPPGKGIPETFWRFNLTQVVLWQRNAWLNYEYARSCRTIAESVKAIRAGNKDCQYPAFAACLAKSFPEFPAKAWVEIDAGARNERLQRVGIDASHDPFGRTDEPVEFLDIHDVLDQVMAGELCFSNAMEDEAVGVFKINFDYEDEAVVTAFAAWLAQRRAELIKRYKGAPVGRRKRNFFEPESRPIQRGHGDNQSQYQIWFNRLAALRLLGEMDFALAEHQTQKILGKPLYSDERSWIRVQQEAGDLMLRFTKAWILRPFPFLLVPRRLSGQIGLAGCNRPFISDHGAWKPGALKIYRKQVRKHIAEEVLPYRETTSR